jgi:pilus assembly protein CpaE
MLKVAIISKNTKTLEELRRFIVADRSHDIHVIQGDMEMLGPTADQIQPDVLIFEMDENEPLEFSLLSRVNILHPHIILMLISHTQSPDVLLHAMRSGVREVLPSPVQREDLQAAIRRIDENLSLQNSARQQGKVFAFIPCKGGSGSTFLASNLGYSLATEENKKVVLLDLGLQFGDAALFVSDTKPPTNLAEVARQISRMDGAFLSSSLLPVLPNYGLLAAPEDPIQAMEVRQEHIQALINLARNLYDIVILDVSRALDPVSIKALDNADLIFPVMQFTLPFIRDARRLLEVFRSLGYEREKVHLIVNRFEKGGEIRMEDVERTLGQTVFWTIPNSFRAVAASVNQGIPINKLSKNNPVTRSLNDMGKALVRKEEESSSWWKSLLMRTPPVEKEL